MPKKRKKIYRSDQNDFDERNSKNQLTEEDYDLIAISEFKAQYANLIMEEFERVIHKIPEELQSFFDKIVEQNRVRFMVDPSQVKELKKVIYLVNTKENYSSYTNWVLELIKLATEIDTTRINFEKKAIGKFYKRALKEPKTVKNQYILEEVKTKYDNTNKNLHYVVFYYFNDHKEDSNFPYKSIDSFYRACDRYIKGPEITAHDLLLPTYAAHALDNFVRGHTTSEQDV